MQPSSTHPTLRPPIIESVLTSTTGSAAKFRWHRSPCPGNESVSIFYYRANGEYEQSFYINRDRARKDWFRLISEGWLVTEPASVVTFG